MTKRAFFHHGNSLLSAFNPNMNYETAMGKSGKRWFYGACVNAADHIYSEDDRCDGFRGRLMDFHTKGKVYTVRGPWKSNANALFLETGVDLRERHFSQGVIALQVIEHTNSCPPEYVDVLHEDTLPVIGAVDRIETLAQMLADKTQQKIHYAVKRFGGSSQSLCFPTPQKEG